MYVPDATELLAFYGSLLRDKFDLYVPELDKLHSQWFKNTYVHPKRSGMML